MGSKAFWKPEKGEGEVYDNFVFIGVRWTENGVDLYNHTDLKLPPKRMLIVANEVVLTLTDILQSCLASLGATAEEPKLLDSE